MPFTDKPQVFNAAINALTFGEAGRELTLGGSNVYPLYAFDAPLANAPRVGVEVSDQGYEKAIPGLAAFYAAAETIPEQAVRAAGRFLYKTPRFPKIKSAIQHPVWPFFAIIRVNLVYTDIPSHLCHMEKTKIIIRDGRH